VKNEVAKPIGLSRPKGRSPQIRIVIPKDLQPHYGGRKDFRISLGPLTGQEAKAKAHQLRAEKDAEFLAKRRELAMLAAPLQEVTPEMAQVIASGVYAELLHSDDHARESREVFEALRELNTVGASAVARALSIGGSTTPTPMAEWSPIDGLPEGEAQVLADLNSLAEGRAAIDLARRRLSAVQPLADKVARRLGLAPDWSTESGRAALRACLEQMRRAWKDRVARDAGEVIATPAMPTESAAMQPFEPQGRQHSLQDVFDRWKVSGDNPSAATVRKKRASVNHYVSLMKDAPIESLTKAMGVEFASALLHACKMEKTAKDHLDGVKSLLNFAVDKLGWLKVNEWAAQSIQVKKRNQRKPWPSDDLRKLVDSPLFKSYELPTNPSAGGAAAYWVPLLGLYTGARQSELCQLRIEDLQDTPEGFVLYVLRDGEDHADGTPGTTTKTEASNRRLPVHSDLIALGLKDYWQDMKDAGHKVLFPDIKRAPDRSAGEYFSDWFLIYRRQQGIDKRWVDFHAFRHTASTRLTDAGVSDSVTDYLTGHSGSGRGSAGRYKAMQEVGPALEKLKYPELELSRVYPIGGNLESKR
jgi:integrase